MILPMAGIGISGIKEVAQGETQGGVREIHKGEGRNGQIPDINRIFQTPREKVH